MPAGEAAVLALDVSLDVVPVQPLTTWRSTVPVSLRRSRYERVYSARSRFGIGG